MSERNCETCKYQTRVDPCPKCWREPGKPSWTAKRPSTLEVLKELSAQMREAVQSVILNPKGKKSLLQTDYEEGQIDAYNDSARIVDAKAKQLEEPEQKP